MSDIERLRREVSLPDLAMDHGVALQKNGTEWEGCCPFHNEHTPSFTIFTGKDGTERFFCFGCNEQGDVVDFVMKLKGVDTRQAIAILGGGQAGPNVKPRQVREARDIYAGIEILPPVEGIAPGERLRLWNPKRAVEPGRGWGEIRPSMAFPYFRGPGDFLGYVLRHDLRDGGKETPMVCWVRLPDGTECWSRMPFPRPRPIYIGGGLDALRQGQVVIVEGEKCADALRRTTGRQGVSWAGGTFGIRHTDWSPLAGRSVVIWPDADGPGVKTGNEIAEILVGLGCTVKVMDLSGRDLADGWDVADAVRDGWTKDQIETLMRETVRTWGAPPPEPEPPAPPPPPPTPEPDPEPPRRARSFDELVAACQTVRPDDTQDVEAILREAAALGSVKQDAILRALKTSTGLAANVLKRQLKDAAAVDEERQVDHLELARRTVRHIGPENIITANAFMWHWDGTGVWRQMQDRLVKQKVQNTLEAEGFPVNSTLVSGVAEVLKTAMYKDGHRFNLGHPDTINCLNGEVAPTDDGWALRPHRRENYRTTQIPVVYDPDAKCPLWQRFLGQIFKGDPDGDDKARALMEMMGYSLMSHALHEKFVLMIGVGGNGKSVVLYVLERLAGADNVAGVQPSNFDRSFQRAHLDQKLVNLVTELKVGEVIADAELKGIVSGERSTVEHKFQDPFDMHPFATCWFGTNHMPHTRDFSEALFRRALILNFNNVFDGAAKDDNLKPKLAEELPGILNMALAAYRRAKIEGFTAPASSEEAKKEWRLEADQVAMFVEDRCTREKGGQESAAALFSAYNEWAKENGVKQTMSQKGMRDRLSKLGFGAHRDGHGRHVTGIRLRAIGGW